MDPEDGELSSNTFILPAMQVESCSHAHCSIRCPWTHSWRMVKLGFNSVLSDSKSHAFSAEEYYTRQCGWETNINDDIEIEL